MNSALSPVGRGKKRQQQPVRACSPALTALLEGERMLGGRGEGFSGFLCCQQGWCQKAKQVPGMPIPTEPGAGSLELAPAIDNLLGGTGHWAPGGQELPSLGTEVALQLLLMEPDPESPPHSPAPCAPSGEPRGLQAGAD